MGGVQLNGLNAHVRGLARAVHKSLCNAGQPRVVKRLRRGLARGMGQRRRSKRGPTPLLHTEQPATVPWLGA